MEAGGAESLHLFFFHLAIILFSAKLLGYLSARVGIPPVLGEVLAGVILGVSVLGIIPVSDAIKVLAELGIILLLFQIGLEADVKLLIRVGASSLIVAIIGAVLPFLGGFLASKYMFGLSTLSSLFIGGALTATSIGITVRVLEDLGKHKDKFAQIVLGAAVIDDIIGVVLLSALYDFSLTKSFEPNTTLRLMLQIALFFLIAPFLANIVAKLFTLVVKEEEGKDIVPPFIVGLMLLFAYIAHLLGSPSILGSFTTGIALSRRFFFPFAAFLKISEKITHTVEESINPLVWVVSPIFFVTVGLSLNLKVIDFTSPQFWFMTLFLTFVAILGKVISGVFAPVSLRDRVNIGLSMMPRGEVGLIFAEFGRNFGVLDEGTYAVLIFVVALTTLLAPILLKLNVKPH